MITAAQLYDHVSCPRRVDLDLHGDPTAREELSAFVRMLWNRGASHEAAIVAGLPEHAKRLTGLPGEERERLTLDAMAGRADIIQGGRISADDLLGDPDLLLRRGDRYITADIKSGRADDGGSVEDGDGRPKAHYAVQVAHYTDILERLGLSAGRSAEIWDVDGRRVTYNLMEARGPRTPTSWWDLRGRERRAFSGRATAAAPGRRCTAPDASSRTSGR